LIVGVGFVTSIFESRNIDRLLIETVDEVLERVLGDVGARAVYGMLRVQYGLDRASIPGSMVYFRESLVELLGSGGEVLLRMIDDRVCDELELSSVDNLWVEERRPSPGPP
jgi:hypothetical protein